MERSIMKTLAKKAIKTNIKLILIIVLALTILDIIGDDDLFGISSLIILLLEPFIRYIIANTSLKVIDGGNIETKESYEGLDVNSWFKIMVVSLIKNLPILIFSFISASLIIKSGITSLIYYGLDEPSLLLANLFGPFVIILILFILCIVIEIMIELNFAFVPLIVVEFKDLSLVDTLKLSKDMMYLHKKDLILLEFSFLPWLLLIMLMGLFMLVPIIGLLIGLCIPAAFNFILVYYDFTVAKFYKEVKIEKDVIYYKNI